MQRMIIGLDADDLVCEDVKCNVASESTCLLVVLAAASRPWSGLLTEAADSAAEFGEIVRNVFSALLHCCIRH